MKLLFVIFFLVNYASTATVNEAIAVISGVGNSISGTIVFTQIDANTVQVAVDIKNIDAGNNPSGAHGIHVHAFGDLRGLITTNSTAETIGKNVTGANSVGSHYDPYGTGLHRCPDGSGNNVGSHEGDLGNWNATGGTISGTKTFTNITVVGSKSIVGRAVVLHATADDCQNLTSSGGRIAVGVIGIKIPAANNTNSASAAGVTGLTSAVCVLQGTNTCTGDNCKLGSAGFVTFSQSGTTITVTAKVYGITTERGFHIHTYGDISSPTGANAGGHWNPGNTTHGLPGDTVKHGGDLGTIQTFQNSTGYYKHSLTYPDSWWSVSNLIGLAVIVHEQIDHGNEPTCNGSAVNGAAGNRTYQCVIGIPNDADQSKTDLLLPSVDTTGLTFKNQWVKVPCVSANTTQPQPSTSTPAPSPKPTPQPGSASFLSFSFLSLLLTYILSLIF
jgi:Cu-Zn family superoxide dismutase